ncbi:MAG: alkaline phosphatase family protein, partial [Sandaracinaceae bacterium]|nr:alkaline phosphatase family protein [Sandaracinaceae bacterium]
MRWALLSIALASCGAGAPSLERPRARPPRLVVVLVYDQLGSSALERLLPLLDEDGAVKRTIARGLYVERAEYEFASTFTAPGHAAIVTGAPPALSGIAANRVWDRERRSVISVMDDGEHAVLGRDGAFASPRRLAAETAGDVLERETDGRAITISISMKDRSAILPGGHRPDVCLWFDKRAGGFTTSTYYAAALPAWASEWQAQHPWRSYLEPVWEPRDRARLEQVLGADAREGEGAYGFDDTFPHDARELEDPDAFLSLPRSVELELALAERAIDALHAGQDEVPDLVTISISAPDYVGHAFGPESWEYADSLVRSDALAGALLARLEARAPGLGVVITSDHGAAPLPERTAERELSGGRMRSEEELPILQRYLQTSLGPFAEVEAWV